jgi:hypothetical protein
MRQKRCGKKIEAQSAKSPTARGGEGEAAGPDYNSSVAQTFRQDQMLSKK